MSWSNATAFLLRTCNAIHDYVVNEKLLDAKERRREKQWNLFCFHSSIHSFSFDNIFSFLFRCSSVVHCNLIWYYHRSIANSFRIFLRTYTHSPKRMQTKKKNVHLAMDFMLLFVLVLSTSIDMWWFMFNLIMAKRNCSRYIKWQAKKRNKNWNAFAE